MPLYCCNSEDGIHLNGLREEKKCATVFIPSHLTFGCSYETGATGNELVTSPSSERVGRFLPPSAPDLKLDRRCSVARVKAVGVGEPGGTRGRAIFFINGKKIREMWSVCAFLNLSVHLGVEKHRTDDSQHKKLATLSDKKRE